MQSTHWEMLTLLSTAMLSARPTCVADISWQGPELLSERAGDVVLVTDPKNPAQLVVKRIVATEGDVVVPPPACHSGFGLHTQGLVEVPPAHVWLSGDNLTASNDSRSYGCVPYQMIRGKVAYQVRAPYCLRGRPVNT